MKTNKFIIENHSKVDDLILFNYILQVFNLGLVSGNDNQYCYLTSFKDGTVIDFEKTKYGYRVYAIYDEKIERRAKEKC